jgi:hypothetical protein
MQSSPENLFTNQPNGQLNLKTKPCELTNETLPTNVSDQKLKNQASFVKFYLADELFENGNQLKRQNRTFGRIQRASTNALPSSTNASRCKDFSPTNLRPNAYRWLEL